MSFVNITRWKKKKKSWNIWKRDTPRNSECKLLFKLIHAAFSCFFFILNIKMSTADKRIMKDTLEVMMEQDENNLITCLGATSDENIFCWKAMIIGLPNTPYEGTWQSKHDSIWSIKSWIDGHFELSVQFPSNYPTHPPHIQFVTPVFHPNIHFKVGQKKTHTNKRERETKCIHPQTGEICLDILKTDWSPAWTLKYVLLAIAQLLANPEPSSSPLNCHAANILACNDRLAYESSARMYTQLYAKRGQWFLDCQIKRHKVSLFFF